MIEPLLADVDWGKVAIFIIFVLGPLLGQLFKGGGDAKVARPRRRQPQVGPPPPRKALDKEIAEFLRQAQKNANRPGAPQQPPPDAVRPPVARPGRQPDERRVGPAQPLRKPPAAQTARPVDAGAGRQRPAQCPKRRPRLTDQVGQHVSEHLDTSSMSRQTESLGGGVRTADQHVESHLHDVFDHQLGELDAQLEANTIRDGTDDISWQELEEKKRREAERRALQINDVVRMVRDPMAIREAIILAEVMNKPISERPSF